MTDNQTYDEYFERFRRRQKSLDDVNGRIRELKEEYQQRLNSMIKTREEHRSEIDRMKRVISTMVELGCDPVEAQLKGDSGTMRIWDDEFSITMSNHNSLHDPNDVYPPVTLGAISGSISIADITSISDENDQFVAYDHDSSGPYQTG